MRRSPSPRVAGRTAPPWRRAQLTVVTNAMSIALECATDAQMKVAMTGGVVRINTHCKPLAAGGVGISDHHRKRRRRNRCRVGLTSDPAAAISSSKKLVESLFRIVLDRSEIDYGQEKTFPSCIERLPTCSN